MKNKKNELMYDYAFKKGVREGLGQKKKFLVELLSGKLDAYGKDRDCCALELCSTVKRLEEVNKELEEAYNKIKND